MQGINVSGSGGSYFEYDRKVNITPFEINMYEIEMNVINSNRDNI